MGTDVEGSPEVWDKYSVPCLRYTDALSEVVLAKEWQDALKDLCWKHQESQRRSGRRDHLFDTKECECVQWVVWERGYGKEV